MTRAVVGALVLIESTLLCLWLIWRLGRCGTSLPRPCWNQAGGAQRISLYLRCLADYPIWVATFGGSSAGDVELEALIDGSPAPRAHMSVAAETALVCGLVALLTAVFSILFGVAMLLGLVAMFSGMVGMVTTHRPNVAGSALTALGMFFGALAIVLVGVRYLGVDSAFGDAVVPWIADQLHYWNTRLPQPH